jgi:hypothetical protein
MTRAAAALALTLAASGCTRALLPAHVILLVPKCPDGLPPRLEVDQACPPNGICGFSCHPSRWDEPALVKGR